MNQNQKLLQKLNFRWNAEKESFVSEDKKILVSKKDSIYMQPVEFKAMLDDLIAQNG